MLCLGFAPLLALVLGATLGAAFPQQAPKSCSLSKYQFLVPHELKAVKKMKDQFVSTNWQRGATGWRGMPNSRSWVTRWMFSAANWGRGGCFPREFGDKEDAGPNFVLVSNPSRLTGFAQRCQKSRWQFFSLSLGLCLQEDIMLLSDRKCNTMLFHRKWNAAELSVRVRRCCKKWVRGPPQDLPSSSPTSTHTPILQPTASPGALGP